MFEKTTQKWNTFWHNVRVSKLDRFQPDSIMAKRIKKKIEVEKVSPVFNRNKIIPDSTFLNTPSDFDTQKFLVKRGSVLAKKKFDGRWASDIIDEGSKFVSARMIITTLEKEFRLIREQEAYLHKDAFDWAMGYSRDDAGRRNLATKGFENQVLYGAANMRSRYDNDTERFVNKDISKGFIKRTARVMDGIVIPENRATVVLYIYTPWIGHRDQVCGGIPYKAPFGNFYFWRLWQIFFGGI